MWATNDVDENSFFFARFTCTEIFIRAMKIFVRHRQSINDDVDYRPSSGNSNELNGIRFFIVDWCELLTLIRSYVSNAWKNRSFLIFCFIYWQRNEFISLQHCLMGICNGNDNEIGYWIIFHQSFSCIDSLGYYIHWHFCPEKCNIFANRKNSSERDRVTCPTILLYEKKCNLWTLHSTSTWHMLLHVAMHPDNSRQPRMKKKTRRDVLISVHFW